MGHVVHSGASEVQNIDTLFFMLGWTGFGSHKKRFETCYTKLFLTGGIYGSHSALWCIQGVKRRCTIFHFQLGQRRIPQKACWDMLCRTCVFASGGIYG
jgi:hypothetical protein